MKKLNMTWEQFQELRLLCEAVAKSKSFGAAEGELKNTIVTGEWTPTGVEIKINLD